MSKNSPKFVSVVVLLQTYRNLKCLVFVTNEDYYCINFRHFFAFFEGSGSGGSGRWWALRAHHCGGSAQFGGAQLTIGGLSRPLGGLEPPQRDTKLHP